MEITKKQILENRELLKEDGWETGLMVAGFIPVIGEIADIALIGLYLYRKEYIYAGLMLIALIPTVGDIIAKPFIRFLKSAGPVGKAALSSSDDMAKYLMSNPAAKEQFIKMSKYFDHPGVTGTVKNLNKVNSSWGQKMLDAVNSLKSTVSKLKPARIGQRVGKEIAAQGAPSTLKMLTGGGPVAMGIKNFFREERLAKYIVKNGQKPSNWIKNWWYIVRTGRKDRRNLIKQFIIANGILDIFGLPNFESFQEKLQTDSQFREQLANDPRFSQMINQGGVVSQEELNSLNGNDSSGIADAGSALMNLAWLKTLARLYT